MITPRDVAIPIERVTWRDGQLLASRDLRDDANNDARLRHLHIRYLHKTWGVVEGLNVVFAGSAAVRVSPGYALDAGGNELLVPVATRVPTPNLTAKTTMYLVISLGKQAATCGPATPDLSTLCPGVRNPVPLDQGQLAWKAVNEVRLGRDVLLARALIANGRLASAIDTSVQRQAATFIQRRMWSDVTQSGQTGWTDGATNPIRELQAVVDTSAAGFIATPAYFARLSGTSQFAAGFISSASAGSFTFVLRPHVVMVYEKPIDAAMAEDAGWTISWFAVGLEGD
jgi:hypothetical protein